MGGQNRAVFASAYDRRIRALTVARAPSPSIVNNIVEGSGTVFANVILSSANAGATDGAAKAAEKSPVRENGKSTT